MKHLTVYLNDGHLKQTVHEGTLYNGHMLAQEITEPLGGRQDANTEMWVYCQMCEEQETVRLPTTEDARLDLLYMYTIADTFDDECPVPYHKVQSAVEKTWREHKGEVFTDEVRLDMKADILAACNDDRVQVSFQ